MAGVYGFEKRAKTNHAELANSVVLRRPRNSGESAQLRRGGRGVEQQQAGVKPLRDPPGMEREDASQSLCPKHGRKTRLIKMVPGVRPEQGAGLVEVRIAEERHGVTQREHVAIKPQHFVHGRTPDGEDLGIPVLRLGKAVRNPQAMHLERVLETTRQCAAEWRGGRRLRRVVKYEEWELRTQGDQLLRHGVDSPRHAAGLPAARVGVARSHGARHENCAARSGDGHSREGRFVCGGRLSPGFGLVLRAVA